jgi:hypothetical protein
MARRRSWPLMAAHTNVVRLQAQVMIHKALLDLSIRLKFYAIATATRAQVPSVRLLPVFKQTDHLRCEASVTQMAVRSQQGFNVSILGERKPIQV